jgi:hypothetical protein
LTLGRRGHEACNPSGVRWNLTVIDPPSFPFTHFLFDTVRMLAFTLEELGQEVSVTQNRLEADCLNVLIGVHLLDDAQQVEEIIDGGKPYIVLQTEMIHGRTINRQASDRLERVILPLCRAARSVWDSSPENIAALASLGIHAELLVFAYQPRLKEIALKAERDIDFFWYGSVTEHRRKILTELDRLGYKVAVSFDAPPLFRNDLIARSEIVLTLRHSDEMNHVPHARILYTVANECVVAGEGGDNIGPLEDVFLWDRKNDVVDFLRLVRARPDLRELGPALRDRLAKRPMRDLMAPLVEAVAA